MKRNSPTDKIIRLRVLSLINRCSFSLFGNRFNIEAIIDKKFGNRVYIQVSYVDFCHVTMERKLWKGRKWYLSSHMTDDEIIKTAFAACKATVEHEIMEGFTVDGTVLFNPHVSFDALLSISDKEVRREVEA